MRHTIIAAVALTFAAAVTAQAQPPGTVVATQPAQHGGDAIRGFVHSYSAPSPASGKLTRWRSRICPAAAGLSASMNAYVVKRVKQVAALAGAPVNDDA